MYDITVFTPTCAIPSNPSTEIIDQAIASVRYHLPDAPYIIGCDGIAPHIQAIEGRWKNYFQFRERLKEKYSSTMYDVRTFTSWHHQSEMLRAVLPDVTTRYLLFQEHDAPLRTDREIHWQTICDVLASGDANMVRFAYWDEGLHPTHMHLKTGEFYRDGVKFIQTRQFSGWPFVTTVEFARRMLDRISPPRPVFLEVALYCDADLDPNFYKMAVYCPDGPVQRFIHLNGRAGDPGCQAT